MPPTTQHPKPVCFYCGPLPVCCPAHKQNVLQDGSSDLLTSLKRFDFSLPEDLKKTFWYSLKDLLPTFLSLHSMTRHRGFLLVMGHTFPSTQGLCSSLYLCSEYSDHCYHYLTDSTSLSNMSSLSGNCHSCIL